MDRAVAQRTSNVLLRNHSAWSHVECLEEFFRDILSRLPVHCLLSSKFVSRHWRGLIHRAQLAELHFSRSAEDVLYIVYSCTDAVKTLHLIDGNGVITEVITLPHSENLSSLRMICSYNGLTCFTNYPWYIHSRRIQCNPATHETRALTIGSPSEAELGMGVAFGQGVSKYKVFHFFSSNFDDDDKEELNPECEIFSSSTGAWRGIGRVQQSPLGAHHIICNGKVYWFMAEEEDRETVEDVLSVDMEGNFKTIELPDDTTDWSYLIDLDGCLSFVVVNCDDRL
ncbi:putative F-box protein At4g17780 [Pyrus communis]|uniref:putative F-box protein At4g17780 n=1 Tax=Pyrus communis TaxID=23211 RepID=UPI0035C0755D